MAILKMINVHVGKNATLKGIINYVLKPKKTEEKLVTGFGCDIPRAFDMMMETKNLFGKLTGRQYYHSVQSFPPNENITPAQAHEAGVRFVEACKKLWGYELILVTHIDRAHIHNHILWNSVNFVDGHKFHITRKELAEMKELQNQICIKMGFSAAPKKGFDMFGKKRRNITANNAKTFRVLKQSENKQKDSYIQNCSEAILKSLKIAKTKEQFIQLMHAQGFDSEWKENKKHITFVDVKRKAAGESKYKVRLNKLAQYFPELKFFKTKEDLLSGIESNNSRHSIAGIASYESDTGGTPELIDFDARYEDYSATIDRERSVQSNEKDARRAEEISAGNQRKTARIAEKNRRRNSIAEQKIQHKSRCNNKIEGFTL